MQTATADPLVGHLLEGRYRILDRIARGGMSTVYAAVDERLDRRVAVKVMSATLSSDPAFTDRFAREARAAARLAHVNAVAVYDQGSDHSAGNHVFLVMELVTGRTLRDLIRERTGAGGRFSTAEAISIMEPVLSALSAAHRAGLVHRDVKPENILLSDDGLVKVADFGLARAVDADAASTRTGLMMGTVAYCAPEQIVHGDSDPRSDVYSAGIVLFELLVGRAPYRGDNAMSVAYQHVHSRVPAPSSQIPQRPSGIAGLIDEIVVAATDSDPAARPTDASAFLAELADARVELALPVVPIPPRVRPTVHGPGPVNTGQRPGPPSAAPTTPNGPASRPGFGAQTDVLHSPAQFDTRFAPTAGDASPPPPVVIPPPKKQLSYRVRRRRRRLIATIIIVLIGLVAAAAGLVAARVWRDHHLHVPKVSLQDVPTASRHLRTAGFTVADPVTHEYSESVPRGEVISTDPSGGEQLIKGRPVTLTVSRGPRLFGVPDLRGSTVSVAEEELGSRNLSYNPTPRTRHSTTVPQSQVIATIPKSGTMIDAHKQIVLVVSSGPPQVHVPDIASDTSFDDAKQKLNDAHFRIHRTRSYSNSVAAGNVISVDPTGTATYGSRLTVTLSRGPHMVTVPEFDRFDSLSDVEQSLTDAHLRYRVRQVYGGELGYVVKLTPGPDTSVQIYSTITITVI